MSLTYGSVCSGIEAATCAWHPLGWKAAFFSEIEAFPRAVLKHHYEDTSLHGDFTTIRAGEYEPIDILVGGTPCQSFSVAGLRGGLDDERGNLALEYLRLADRLRPRWLVWENVPGVLSSAGGRDFGSILGGMVELGYGIAYRVLDAQFFGVAQRRRRVFVVGHLGDWRRAAAVLFERHGLSGHPSPRRQTGEGAALSAAFGISPDCFDRDGEGAGGTAGERSGLGVDRELAYALRAKRPGGVASIAPALSSNPYGDHESREGLLVAHSLRGEGFDASEDGTGRGTPIVPVCFDPRQSDVLVHGDKTGPLDTGFPGPAICFSSKDHGADAESDLSPTLRAGGHDGSHPNAGVPPAIAFALRGREGGAMPEVGGDGVSALRAAGGGSSRDYIAGTVRSHTRPGSNEVGSIVATSAVRRLTPRECERLQGFPDDYTLIPWRNAMAPDGPRYKALGNSMAVPCMSWIGRRIAMVEALDLEAP